MRIHIQVYDDNDFLIGEGETILSPANKEARKGKARGQGVAKHAPKKSIDFSLPERAFFKRYSAPLSGPKQFVLMLAYLAEGKPGKEVELSEIKSRWNKMTSIFHNEFNPPFTNSAKERGWVDTKKTGRYILHSTWSEILVN